MAKSNVTFTFKKRDQFEGKPAYDAYLYGEHICAVFKKESGSWAVVSSSRFRTGYNTRSDAARSQVSMKQIERLQDA